MAVGPGPSYGSSEAGVLLNILIMSCDKPFGWLELVLAEAELAAEDVDLADVCGPAGARVGGPVCALVDEVVLGAAVDLADCGPVRALEEVLGAVGKKLSEVSMIGEKRILVCLFVFHVSLHDSFSSFSSSEL